MIGDQGPGDQEGGMTDGARAAGAERPDDVEKLAALAHEQWSGWMEHLFSKCWEAGTDDFRRPMPGSVVIPPEQARRWKRQKRTPYADLPEEEKESDRVEARKVIALLGAAGGAKTLHKTEASCGWDAAGGKDTEARKLREENEALKGAAWELARELRHYYFNAHDPELLAVNRVRKLLGVRPQLPKPEECELQGDEAERGVDALARPAEARGDAGAGEGTLDLTGRAAGPWSPGTGR